MHVSILKLPPSQTNACIIRFLTFINCNFKFIFSSGLYSRLELFYTQCLYSPRHQGWKTPWTHAQGQSHNICHHSPLWTLSPELSRHIPSRSSAFYSQSSWKDHQNSPPERFSWARIHQHIKTQHCIIDDNTQLCQAAGGIGLIYWWVDFQIKWHCWEPGLPAQ